jgi:hypothetical protein
VTITKKELDEVWWMWTMHHRCKNPKAAKEEILALFSEEPDDEHEWSEQDIYEQSRKIIMKYS